MLILACRQMWYSPWFFWFYQPTLKNYASGRSHMSLPVVRETLQVISSLKTSSYKGNANTFYRKSQWSLPTPILTEQVQHRGCRLVSFFLFLLSWRLESAGAPSNGIKQVLQMVQWLDCIFFQKNTFYLCTPSSHKASKATCGPSINVL